MDLSILPDDQLLQLIEAVTKEVARRAIAIQFATGKYWQDAKEDIETNVTQPSNRASDEDSTKATVIRLLKNLDFFSSYRSSQFSINIWEKQGDIRLYLQESFRVDGWRMTYYHTGNKWNLPGTVNAPDLQPHLISDFKSFSKLLCYQLTPGFKCYGRDDDNYTVNFSLLQILKEQLCRI